MKKNMTEIVFILDRSGSMAGLEKDTICSFNSMIEKQRRQEGDAYISTVLFDNYSEVIHQECPQVFPGGGPSGKDHFCYYYRRNGKYQSQLQL